MDIVTGVLVAFAIPWTYLVFVTAARASTAIFGEEKH